MNFSLVGDIALHGLISSEPGINGERFGWLGSQLGRYSGTLANLEVPVSGKERNPEKKAFLFSDTVVTGDILKRLNVICVSLANNHILDCGKDGLKNTLALLDNAGIYHTGAGFNEEQIKPVVFSLDGVRIGFAAYADISTRPGVGAYNELYFNTFDVTKAISDLKSIREKVKIAIISIHWGRDYSYYPDELQIRTARLLVESGANIIMGHHSHTLQTFENYKSGHIFYGLGSLTFGDFIKNRQTYALFRKTKNSAIFVVNDNCELTDAIPTHEKKGNFVIPGSKDVLKRNSRLAAINRARLNNRLLNFLVRFNENVLYRIYEYFFGYYMNPVRRLFQVGNIKKIKRLFG